MEEKRRAWVGPSYIELSIGNACTIMSAFDLYGHEDVRFLKRCRMLLQVETLALLGRCRPLDRDSMISL
jgi:hypothetical protein